MKLLFWDKQEKSEQKNRSLSKIYFHIDVLAFSTEDKKETITFSPLLKFVHRNNYLAFIFTPMNFRFFARSLIKNSR